MKNALKYRIHKTIAIIVVPTLIISTITGIFKTNMKWIWAEGYKKKKHPSSIVIKDEIVSINRLKAVVDSVTRKDNKFETVILRSEVNRLYFEIVTVSKEKFLTDAYTSEIISPITKQLAGEFATQYLNQKAEMRSCELIRDYIPRKKKEKKEVYKVTFNNDLNSVIYLDLHTGEIVEEEDDGRTVGLWVMKLHEFDFFDSKRGISIFVGICFLLLALSGLWIYKLRNKTNQRVV